MFNILRHKIISNIFSSKASFSANKSDKKGIIYLTHLLNCFFNISTIVTRKNTPSFLKCKYQDS